MAETTMPPSDRAVTVNPPPGPELREAEAIQADVPVAPVKDVARGRRPLFGR